MGARILIADDHELMRKGIRTLLESRGDFELLEATNGKEAIEKTLDSKPDVVILDVSMPILDGFSAAKEIRKISPGTPILMLTFQKSDNLAEIARNIGVQGYLTKGEDSAALLKAVDEAVTSRIGQAASVDESLAPPIAISSKVPVRRMPNRVSHPRLQALPKPFLRLLFLHSRADYIGRCLEELEEMQFKIRPDIVRAPAQFVERLTSKYYDIVLAEYPNPDWQTKQILSLLKSTDRRPPLILVTPKMEREAVGALIMEGVADCVEMNNLRDLPIAIRRALKESTLRGQQRQMERRLQHSEAHYRALVGNPTFGICRCSLEGQFLDVNPAMAAMLGYESKDELFARNLAGDIIHDPSKRAQLLGKEEKDRVEPLEVEWKRRDNSILKVRLSGREVRTEEGKADGYEIIAEDVTRQREIEDDLRQQATKDPLTGLANSRTLETGLQSEIERSKRTGREFTLLLFDLDGLKQINDHYGHIAGSEAICRLADVLAAGCRNIDTAARFGGDEFAVVLPETDAGPAALAAGRLCDDFANDGKHPSLTVSCGIATYPADGETVEALFIAADVRLYAMKSRVYPSLRMNKRARRMSG